MLRLDDERRGRAAALVSQRVTISGLLPAGANRFAGGVGLFSGPGNGDENDRSSEAAIWYIATVICAVMKGSTYYQARLGFFPTNVATSHESQIINKRVVLCFCFTNCHGNNCNITVR